MTHTIRQGRSVARQAGRHLTSVSAVRPSPAVRAFTTYLNRQADDILAGDAGLRRGDDPFQRTRTAARRFRSTLGVYRPLLDRDAAAHIDRELRWFSRQLGVIRDCQVQRRRLAAALDETPDTLVPGPVVSDIRNHLASVELPARVRLDEALDSQRYLAMIAVLRCWSAEPMLTAEPVAKGLRTLGEEIADTADRRLVVAVETDDPALLHWARKAAARARHAAELRRPLDDAAAQTVKRYKRIQRVLGEHRDAVVASELLRRLGAAHGSAAARNGFTYGLLYAREQGVAADRLRAARKLA